MRVLADFTTQDNADGGTTLAFHGPLVVSSIGALDHRLRALTGSLREIDMTHVEEIDTVGAWIVWRLSRDSDAKIVACSGPAERLIEAIKKSADNREAIREHRAPLPLRVAASVGEVVIGLGQGAKRVIGLLGQEIGRAHV